MDQNCIFQFKYDCKHLGNCAQNKDSKRIENIIRASKIYKDDLHTTLEHQLSSNAELKVSYHRNCVSRYTSKTNYTYSLKKTDELPVKRLRKSLPQFDFLQHCLYCGEKCSLEKDPKHPKRWKEAYLCRSTISTEDNQSYKQYILKICQERGDIWGNDVQTRVEGAVADLHAVEAR